MKKSTNIAQDHPQRIKEDRKTAARPPQEKKEEKYHRYYTRYMKSQKRPEDDPKGTATTKPEDPMETAYRHTTLKKV